MSDNFVYNRAERILRMKDLLETKLWDLEDLNKEIQDLQFRIKQLEEKERGV